MRNIIQSLPSQLAIERSFLILLSFSALTPFLMLKVLLWGWSFTSLGALAGTGESLWLGVLEPFFASCSKR